MRHHLLRLAFDNLFIFLHAFEEQEHEGRDRGTKSRLSATFTI
jgi:hypothetical protein